MSLRPMIAGFDLSAFRALLGSRDAVVSARVTAALPLDGDADARSIALRAIDEGVPLPEVGEEGPAHVAAALAFASLVPSVPTMSTVMGMSGFDRLATLLPALVQPKSPFRVFLAGRPLFGKTFAERLWSYYGWLSRAELVVLRNTISKLRDGFGTGPVRDPSVVATAVSRLRAQGALVTADELPGFFDALDAAHAEIGDVAKGIAWETADRLKLRAGLQAFYTKIDERELESDPYGAERSFVSDLDGWLRVVAEADLDLWFYAD